MAGRIIILSGPSGIGKTPLWKALHGLHPDTCRSLTRLILFNSRSARPGENDGVDYHFRSRERIIALEREGELSTVDVRGDLHGLDIEQTMALLNERDVFYEGNPYVACRIMEEPRLRGFPRISIFLSPLSLSEINFFKDPVRNTDLSSMIQRIMEQKLLRRARALHGELSLGEMRNVEHRAQRAFAELRYAWKFDAVVPNHDGEDSENWTAFSYPIGDARTAVETVHSLIAGLPQRVSESWSLPLLG